MLKNNSVNEIEGIAVVQSPIVYKDHNKYYQFIGTTTIPPFIPNVTWNLFFYDDIINDINFNILEKDYKNYLKFFSNNKSNYLSYDNEKRQSQPIRNNFISIKEIN